MIELRRTLTTYLKSVHPRVFFQVAPDDAVYPYLVLDFPNDAPDGEGLEVVVVDIDGWDDDTDTTALEALMAAVNGNGDRETPTGLNHRTLKTDTLVASFYIDRKLPLRDTDPRLRRRKYVYQARLFERT